MIRIIFLVATVLLGIITIYCIVNDESKLASIITTILTILSLIIAIYPKMLEQKVKPDIKLNANSLELLNSDEYDLKATISLDYYNINWDSDNENIVIVDNNGHLKAIADGNTTITASIVYKDVEYSDTCNVSVKSPSITLDRTQSLYVGEIKSLAAITTPENVSILWKSNNSNIVTVNDNGEIDGISVGTATITATITYNSINYSANCDIEVKSSTDESDNILSDNNEQEATDSNAGENNLFEEAKSTDVSLSDVVWLQSEKAYKSESATTMRGELWDNCIQLGSNNLNADGNAIIVAVCDQKYSQFTAEISPQEGFDTSEEVTIYIYGMYNDEQIFLETYQIDYMTKNISINIDISGIDDLRIEKVGDYNMARIAGQYINGYTGMGVLIRDATLHK